jgi:hypothetical protein
MAVENVRIVAAWAVLTLLEIPLLARRKKINGWHPVIVGL